MVGRGDPVNAPGRRGLGAAVAAGVLFALAGHLGLIRAFGTVLPYRDQWQCTGVDLLAPWAAGRLSLANFFAPLNDHWPVLTRLLSFGLLRANGQWNNLLEATVNALLFAGAVALFLRMVLPGLRGWARPAFAALSGLVLALPITWENTLWGIQSLVYLQIGLSLVYLAAMCSQRAFTGGWWTGIAAGIVVLFTQHSAILAHVAVAVLLGWRWWRRDGDRRVALAGLAFAVAVLVAFVLFFPSITVTAALRADSWELALDVFLRQLAWPLPHPAWALLVYLPWVAWAFDRLLARTLGTADAFILVCGLWVGGQAAAIGYGRAAETFSFASRYCDFLALGWLLNAAALARFWIRLPRPAARGALVVLGLLWIAAPLRSFWWETTESHAGFNLSHRQEINLRNLERLRTVWARHDPTALPNDPGTQQELFTYPPALPPLLAQPRIQAVLPPETGSPLARPDHGRLGWIPALLLPLAPWLAAGGFVLLGWSLLRVGPLRPVDDAEAVPDSALTPRAAAAALAVVGVLSAVGWAAWYDAGTFDPRARFASAFAPLDDGVVFTDLEFRRYDGNVHPVVSARGAVDTEPALARGFWYGTRLKAKADFHGVLASAPTRVQRRYLVVPFTGHPCFPGNGLRWRFTDPQTGAESWASYVGADPGTDWNLWTLDAREHAGAAAALFLFDGGAGETGWLGVGRPAQTDDAGFARRWSARLHAERAGATHVTLAGLTLAAGLAAGLLFVLAARRR